MASQKAGASSSEADAGSSMLTVFWPDAYEICSSAKRDKERQKLKRKAAAAKAKASQTLTGMSSAKGAKGAHHGKGAARKR